MNNIANKQKQIHRQLYFWLKQKTESWIYFYFVL